MTTANTIEAEREVHTARKIHRCNECNNKIAPGEDYIRSVSVTKTEEGRNLSVKKRHVRNCTDGPNVVEKSNGQLKFGM